jgi:predicted transcriptional regulator YdeE
MKIINKDKMLLVGLETRTSNQAELSGQGKIAGTIQKFYEKYLAQIANRADNSVLAVYTDYDSDEHGEYTYFYGVSVNNAENIPDGLSVRTIQTASYEVLSSRTGPLHDIVFELWQKVWQDSTLKQRRAYLADFEVYDERCQDMTKAQVDAYISIKA